MYYVESEEAPLSRVTNYRLKGVICFLTGIGTFVFATMFSVC
jgi:hypothetical protein